MAYKEGPRGVVGWDRRQQASDFDKVTRKIRALKRGSATEPTTLKKVPLGRGWKGILYISCYAITSPFIALCTSNRTVGVVVVCWTFHEMHGDYVCSWANGIWYCCRANPLWWLVYISAVELCRCAAFARRLWVHIRWKIGSSNGQRMYMDDHGRSCWCSDFCVFRRHVHINKCSKP